MVIPPSDAADLVAVTPILEAAAWDTRWGSISIAVAPELRPLLADGPCGPHLLPPPLRGRAGWLRGLGADACLLLTEERGWTRSARKAGLSLRAGAGGGLGRADFTHAVVPVRSEGRRVPGPAGLLWRDVSGLLGVWPADLRPRLYVSAEEDAALRRRLGAQGMVDDRFVVCAPSSDTGTVGIWPPERHAAVLDELRDTHGLGGVVCVSRGDEDLAEEIAAAARHPVGGLIDDEGRRSAKAALAHAALVVTTDAFARVGAAAFGTPCVYLAGPGPIQRGSVPGEHAAVVFAGELECAPCLRPRCTLGHHRCMLDLTAERVVGAAGRLLATAAEREPVVPALDISIELGARPGAGAVSRLPESPLPESGERP